MTSIRKTSVSIGLVALTVLLLAGLFWRLSPQISRDTYDTAAAASTDPSASVVRGTFLRTIRLNGLVEAVHFSTVMAPSLAGQSGSQLVITQLAKKGARVKKGDLLVEFDREMQLRNATDRRAEWMDLDEQIRKRRADQDAQRAKDDTELKAAENAVALAKLEMLKNEMLPRIDAEKNQLTLEGAEAKLRQLQRTFDLKRQAALTDIRILDVQRERAHQAMTRAESNAQRMAIQSPIDGLVVLRTSWRSGTMADVEEGQEMWPGSGVLDVVGPGVMRVRAKVNQADLPWLRVGQTATVRLDAYPDREFAARLEQLSPIGTSSGLSNAVRTFVALFTVPQSDELLAPDLSAAVDVELERVDNAMLAPRAAITYSDGKPHLRVRNGSRVDLHPVTLGAMNDLQVVVASGVEPGTIVDLVADRSIGARSGGSF